VIYDATNLSYKKRKIFLERLNTECHKKCVLVATPYEKCLEQNNQRNRKVPEKAIEKMYKNFFVPQYYEGWDGIEIVYNDQGNHNLNELLKELDNNFTGQSAPHIDHR
jgi:predicted kinase